MFKEDYGEKSLSLMILEHTGENKYFHNTKRIVKKVEKKMVKIGIVFLEFSIRLKKKLRIFAI